MASTYKLLPKHTDCSLADVEKVATTTPTTGRTTGRHTFMKLLMPIDNASLPTDRIAKAGITYTIPFMFVVPDRLLPQACNHAKEHSGLQSVHLNLPPSLGDPMLASDGQSLMDDMAPEMSKIIYSIRVKVTKVNQAGRIVGDADKAVRLRIMPVREELPPVDISEDNKDYEIRTEKDVKKGLFKVGKIGRLTAETMQPKSLRLPPPSPKSQAPVTTMTTVNLRFDPHDPGDVPPALGSIISKLRVQTFFGASPFKNIPSKANMNIWDIQKSYYTETVELSSRCISTVSWGRHDSTESSNDSTRRPSVFSTSSTNSIPEASAAYTGGRFWTASVLVPISLPSNKAFPPSFHSCIVSRVYVLEFNISFSTPGSKVSTSSIMLRVPIQISCEGNPDAAPTICAEEAAAIARREAAEEYFLPRSIVPPSPEYTETSTLIRAGQRHVSLTEPPEYCAPSNPFRRTHSVAC